MKSILLLVCFVVSSLCWRSLGGCNNVTYAFVVSEAHAALLCDFISLLSSHNYSCSERHSAV